jgi:hypothetical protein
LEQGYSIEEQDGMYRMLSAEPDAAAARRWKLLSAIRRGGGSAKERMLQLLSEPVGAVVTGAELSYVAGGRDPGPLVRELRDDDGLPIDSAIDSRDLHGEEYRLLSLDPAELRDDRQRLFPESVRAQVFSRDNYTCWRCRRDRDEASEAVFYVQIHHLGADSDSLDRLPVAELVDPARLATYCQSCLSDERATVRRVRRLTDHQQIAEA